MTTKKVRNFALISVIFVLIAVFTGIFALNGSTEQAEAFQSLEGSAYRVGSSKNGTTLTELWNGSSFNSAAAEDLSAAILQGTGYSTVAAYVNAKTTVDCATLSANAAKRASGKNAGIEVKLGGINWLVTYLSKSTEGKVIATLYACDPITTAQFHTSNVSTYNGSAIETRLKNGTDLTQLNNATFKQYVTTPNKVSWQTSGANPGGYSAEPAATQAWGADYFWLPSMTETYYGASSYTQPGGTWNLTQDQRGFATSTASYVWLRTANNSSRAYRLYYNGDNCNSNASNTYGLRPALHLNLESVAPSATKITVPTLSTSTATYNGSAQAFSLSNWNSTAISMSVNNSGSANNSTGTVSVTNAATYTVTMSLKDTNLYHWADDSITNKTLTITINAKSIAGATVTAPDNATYTGSAITNKPKAVKDGNTSLTENTHYTLSYTNNTNAGTATVTITGKGNYSGTKTTTFTINRATVALPTAANKTYNMSAQTIISGYDSGKMTMATNMSYTAPGGSATNITANTSRTDAGSYVYTFTPGSNYCWSGDSGTGSKTVTATINQYSVSNLNVDAIAAVTYKGSAYTPTPAVKHGTTALTKDTHYTLSYTSNTNAGTAKVTVSAKASNYTGTKDVEFTINPAALTVTVTGNSFTYDGKTRVATNDSTTVNAPQIKIAVKATTVASQAATVYLKKTATSVTTAPASITDTTVSFTNVADAGRVWYKVTAPNHSTKTAYFDVDITRKDIDLPAAVNDLSYTGLGQNVVTGYDGNLMSVSVRYTPVGGLETDAVAAIQQVSAGTYALTFTPGGNYRWAVDSSTAGKTVLSTIGQKSLTDAVWTNSGSYIYNGMRQGATAEFTVSCGIVTGDTVTAVITYTGTVADGTFYSGTLMPFNAVKAESKYTATVTGLGGEHADNYKLPASGLAEEFVISPLTATLSWSNLTFVYDGTQKAPTATVTNAITRNAIGVADVVTVNVSGGQTDANTGNGKYTATAASLAGAKAGNYKLPDTGITAFFTVTPAPLTVNIEPITELWNEFEAVISSEQGVRWTVSADGTQIYYQNGIKDDVGITLTKETGTDIGSYDITGTWTNTNYDVTFTGETDAFTLVARDISVAANGVYIENIADATYNGQLHTPEVKVVYGIRGVNYLTLGTDYEIKEYKNNGVAGTASVTVKGIGNFDGELTKNFTIKPITLTEIKWAGDNSEFTYDYDGQAHGIDGSVGVDQGVLSGESVVVTVYYSSAKYPESTAKPVNAWVYTARASISDTNYALPENYTQAFTIFRKEVEIDWTVTEFPYDGQPHVATATVGNLVTVGGVKDEIELTVVGAAINARTAPYTATVTTISGRSRDNYVLSAGNTTVTSEFTVVPAVITVGFIAQQVTYSGMEPIVLAEKDVTWEVKSGEIYSQSAVRDSLGLSMTKNAGVKVGKYVISGAWTNRNYNVSFESGADMFEIVPLDIASESITAAISGQVYTGSYVQPAPALTYMLRTLARGTDYDYCDDVSSEAYAYVNNENVGTATLTVSGRGNFTGDREIEFAIGKAPIVLTAPSVVTSVKHYVGQALSTVAIDQATGGATNPRGATEALKAVSGAFNWLDGSEVIVNSGTTSGEIAVSFTAVFTPDEPDNFILTDDADKCVVVFTAYQISVIFNEWHKNNIGIEVETPVTTKYNVTYGHGFDLTVFSPKELVGYDYALYDETEGAEHGWKITGNSISSITKDVIVGVRYAAKSDTDYYVFHMIQKLKSDGTSPENEDACFDSSTAVIGYLRQNDYTLNESDLYGSYFEGTVSEDNLEAVNAYLKAGGYNVILEICHGAAGAEARVYSLVGDRHTLEGFTYKRVTDGTKLINADGTTVLYPKYIRNRYTVKWSGNGGKLADGTDQDGVYAYGAKISVADDPTYIGYAFQGWTLTAKGTTAWDFDAQFMGTSNITFYAIWTAIEYSVKFIFEYDDAESEILEDGFAVTNYQGYQDGITFKESQSVTLKKPVAEGYSFSGWYYKSAIDTAYDAMKSVDKLNSTWLKKAYASSENEIYLYAKWKAASYQITLNGNGVNVPASAAKFRVTNFTNYPSGISYAPTRAGYDFGGWYLTKNPDLDDDEAIDEDSIVKIKANTTLYACWLPIGYIIECEEFFEKDGTEFSTDSEIEFYVNNVLTNVEDYDEDGGRYVGEGVVYKGNVIRIAVTPTDGFVLKSITVAGTTISNNGTYVVADGYENKTVSVTVEFEYIRYNISYIVNKGEWTEGYTPVASYTALDEIDLPTSSDISRSGYEFLGWYREQNLVDPDSADQITKIDGAESHESMVLYMYWTPVSQTVTVNLNNSNFSDQTLGGEWSGSIITGSGKTGEEIELELFLAEGYYILGLAETETAAISYPVQNIAGIEKGGKRYAIVKFTVQDKAADNILFAKWIGTDEQYVLLTSSNSNPTFGGLNTPAVTLTAKPIASYQESKIPPRYTFQWQKVTLDGDGKIASRQNVGNAVVCENGADPVTTLDLKTVAESGYYVCTLTVRVFTNSDGSTYEDMDAKVEPIFVDIKQAVYNGGISLSDVSVEYTGESLASAIQIAFGDGNQVLSDDDGDYFRLPDNSVVRVNYAFTNAVTNATEPINAGYYKVIVSFTMPEGSNYQQIAPYVATLEIRRKVISSLIFTSNVTDGEEYAFEKIYDGSAIIISATSEDITETDLNNNRLTIVLGENSNIAVGEYTAVFSSITGTAADNYIIDFSAAEELTREYSVLMATYDMDGVEFTVSDNIVYDGSTHSAVLSGTLPDGVAYIIEVEFEANNTAHQTVGEGLITVSGTEITFTEAGTYRIKATFAGDSANYYPIADKTVEFEVKKANYTIDLTQTDGNGDAFVNNTVEYGATKKHLPTIVSIEDNDDLSVEYEYERIDGDDVYPISDSERVGGFTAGGTYRITAHITFADEAVANNYAEIADKVITLIISGAEIKAIYIYDKENSELGGPDKNRIATEFDFNQAINFDDYINVFVEYENGDREQISASDYKVLDGMSQRENNNAFFALTTASDDYKIIIRVFEKQAEIYVVSKPVDFDVHELTLTEDNLSSGVYRINYSYAYENGGYMPTLNGNIYDANNNPTSNVVIAFSYSKDGAAYTDWTIGAKLLDAGNYIVKVAVYHTNRDYNGCNEFTELSDRGFTVNIAPYEISGITLQYSSDGIVWSDVEKDGDNYKIVYALSVHSYRAVFDGLDGEPVISVGACSDSLKSAGEYYTVNLVSGDSNYVLASTVSACTVNVAKLAVTAQWFVKVDGEWVSYDVNEKQLVYTGESLLGNVKVSYTDLSGTEQAVDIDALTFVDVGKYDLGATPDVNEDKNYDIDGLTLTDVKIYGMTVLEATLKYKDDEGNWQDVEAGVLEYKGEVYDLAATFSVQGTEYSEVPVYVYEGESEAVRNAGDYTLTVGEYGNYYVTRVFSLHISRYAVVVEIDNKVLTYNGKQQQFTATGYGVGDESAISVITVGGENTATEVKVNGDYQAIIEISEDYVKNYKLLSADIDGKKAYLWDISPLVAEFTWTNTEKTYTGESQLPDVTISNLADSDKEKTFRFGYLVEGNASTPGIARDVGVYTIYANAIYHEVGSLCHNYIVDGSLSNSTRFEIKHGNIVVTQIGYDIEQYGGTNVTYYETDFRNDKLIGTVVNNSGAEISGAFTFSVENSGTGTVEAVKEYGYVFTPDNANYSTVSGTIGLTVKPLRYDRIVVASARSYTDYQNGQLFIPSAIVAFAVYNNFYIEDGVSYGRAEESNLNTDVLTFKYRLGEGSAWRALDDATALTVDGTDLITVYKAEVSTATLVGQDGSPLKGYFDISVTAMEITDIEVVAGKLEYYAGEKFSLVGLRIKITFADGTDRTVGTNIEFYNAEDANRELTVSDTEIGLKYAYYSERISCPITVSPKVDFDVVYNDKVLVENGMQQPIPTATFNAAELVNGETYDGITVRYAVTKNGQPAVLKTIGFYTVTLTFEATEEALIKYNIPENKVITVEIQDKPTVELSITVDAQWTYGDGVDHTPTVSVDVSEARDRVRIVYGERNGSFTTTIMPVKAGAYKAKAIVDGFNASDNETVYKTSESGEVYFTIEKAPLTVTLANVSLVFDSDDAPAYSVAKYEGFVNGENVGVLKGALTYACDYDKTAAIGTRFDITANGYAEENYSITYVKGILTIVSDKSEGFVPVEGAVYKLGIAVDGIFTEKTREQINDLRLTDSSLITYLTGVGDGDNQVNLSMFLSQFEPIIGLTVKGRDIDGNELDSDGIIGTGAVIELWDGEICIDRITVIMLGDINGDGEVDAIDQALMQRLILEIDEPSEAQFMAGDVNGDGEIDAIDQALTQSHILGQKSLHEELPELASEPASFMTVGLYESDFVKPAMLEPEVISEKAENDRGELAVSISKAIEDSVEEPYTPEEAAKGEKEEAACSTESFAAAACLGYIKENGVFVKETAIIEKI